MRYFLLILLLAFVWMGCSFQDPPAPPSSVEILDAQMLSCADLERDTVFQITEQFATGLVDTSFAYKKYFSTARAPRFAGESWYLRWTYNHCIQIILSAPPEPVTPLDSAQRRYSKREDSLKAACHGSQYDTILQEPINHPLPKASLLKILTLMLDTAHGDTLRTTLPTGYGFALLGEEQGIRFVQNGTRLAVGESLVDPAAVPSAASDLRAFTIAPCIDTTEYPQQIYPNVDSLLVPLLPQKPWGLRIWDAYGFVDTLEFNSTGG